MQIRSELLDFGCEVDVLDPWADYNEVKEENGFNIIKNVDIDIEDYSGVIVGLAHNEFKNIKIKTNSKIVVYDINGILNKEMTDSRL